MDIENLAMATAGTDPAAGLRAALALHRLAERVEGHQVAAARKQGWSWQQIGDALGVTRQSVHAKYGEGKSVIAHSTNADTYHPWGTYIRAREEARRRGDRRCGTEHLFVALLSDPEIEETAGVTVGRARGALDSLDRTALEALGFDTTIDAPPLPTRDIPIRPTITAVLRDRLPLTPAAKAALRDAGRPMRRGRSITPQQVLACLLRLEHPDPAASLLEAVGVDPAALQRRLSTSSPTGG